MHLQHSEAYFLCAHIFVANNMMHAHIHPVLSEKLNEPHNSIDGKRSTIYFLKCLLCKLNLQKQTSICWPLTYRSEGEESLWRGFWMFFRDTEAKQFKETDLLHCSPALLRWVRRYRDLWPAGPGKRVGGPRHHQHLAHHFTSTLPWFSLPPRRGWQ